MNCKISFAADIYSYMPNLLPAPETGIMAKTGTISVMKTDVLLGGRGRSEKLNAAFLRPQIQSLHWAFVRRRQFLLNRVHRRQAVTSRQHSLLLELSKLRGNNIAAECSASSSYVNVLRANDLDLSLESSLPCLISKDSVNPQASCGREHGCANASWETHRSCCESLRPNARRSGEANETHVLDSI